MPKQLLRILCYGDSLTAGYSAFGTIYHPYSEVLEQKLVAAFPDLKVDISESGMPGDLAINGAFLTRLNSELSKGRFDWTIVLGGTNDLGYGIGSERIFTSLKEVWAAPLAKGSRVLALTVPECHAKRETLDNKRNQLNSSILGYRKPNYYTFDLHGAIPYNSLSEEDREKYWDDGLHMTSEGYDWMGGHIADALINIISKERRSGRRGVRPEDDVVLEEERGDPTDIRQGYVVVRKRDLD